MNRIALIFLLCMKILYSVSLDLLIILGASFVSNVMLMMLNDFFDWMCHLSDFLSCRAFLVLDFRCNTRASPGCRWWLLKILAEYQCWCPPVFWKFSRAGAHPQIGQAPKPWFALIFFRELLQIPCDVPWIHPHCTITISYELTLAGVNHFFTVLHRDRRSNLTLDYCQLIFM